MCNTFPLAQAHHFVRKLLCASEGLVRIETPIHLVKLALRSETNFLFKVYPAWPYEGWVEPVKMIGCHENKALFRRCHAI